MFWILILAHFIADYPLQTDRIVAAKQHLPGLTVHVAIHWIVMTLLTWPVRVIVWPYVLAITIFHFGIDYFKVFLGRNKPQWIIGPYLWDQPLHWLSLILVCYWMSQKTTLTVWEVLSPWWVYGIGLLMATHVWFVTERVFSYRNPELQALVVKNMWFRMGVRFVLFVTTMVMIITQIVYLLLLMGLLLGGTIYLYRRKGYIVQWQLIDVAVALFSALMVFIILAIF